MRTIVLVVLAAMTAQAQATNGLGAIRGFVRDESDAVVPQAQVAVTDDSRGFVREAETDSRGSFVVPSLTAGVYVVRVSKAGFADVEMRGVKVEVGSQSALALTLRVGGFQTALTVLPPSSAELEAESNTLGSTVDGLHVQNLPLNGRNFLQLARLAAASVDVSPVSTLFATNVGPSNRTIVLPGTLPNSVTYFLNGVDVTGSRDGELALSPSIAAIDQFRVQQGFLMPDQGYGPASVSVVTRGGGNRLHGEVWEFLRNRRLDARSFFAPRREDLKRNQFGVAAGGPLRKDRLWLFGFYEGLRELTAFSVAGYSPTAEMFAGNFSATGRVIYDPDTFDAATGLRRPFPGNLIPAGRINPVSRKLLDYYLPGSSLSAVPANLQGNPRRTLNDNQGGARFDAALSPRQQFFAQFLRQDTPAEVPGLYPLSGLLYLNHSTFVMVEHVWTPTARVVNTLQASFFRNAAVGTNQASGRGPILPAIGIANTFSDEGVTAVILQGYSSFGRASGDVGNRDNTWQVNDDLAIQQSGHSLALGGGLLYRRGRHANGNSVALGSLSFQPAFTTQLARNAQGQLSPVPGAGDAFADFLLGYPINGLLTGAPPVEFRATRVTPFIQDNWRVRPGLTLNYGLSWYLETPPNPQGRARDNVHVFDSQTGLLKFAGLGEVEPRTARLDSNNLSPRLGVAWAPRALKNTVLRAAAGLYYGAFPWSFAVYPVGPGSPNTAGTGFTNSVNTPLPAYVLGSNIFPPSSRNVLTPDYASSLPPGTAATALDPGFRSAYRSQWNFSIQHSFGAGTSAQLDYIGSSGHRLPNVADLSQCRPTAGLFCSGKTWPRYGLLIYGDSNGNSSYEALIGKFERRVGSSFNLRVEFSFGKALTDAYQSSLSSNNQIASCRRCSKGPATFDVRHRAVGSLVWDLPFGRERRFANRLSSWTDHVIGGWTLTAITTFATGQPVTLTAPNQTGSGFITPLPNRVCDGNDDRLSHNVRGNGFLWFDTTCFPTPPPGYFGNSGATVITGPGVNNWDVGAHKAFRLPSESMRIQFRVEAFNVWNHAQFEMPNGNAGAGANFGRISAARPPRLVQAGMKVYW